MIWLYAHAKMVFGIAKMWTLLPIAVLPRLPAASWIKCSLTEVTASILECCVKQA